MPTEAPVTVGWIHALALDRHECTPRTVGNYDVDVGFLLSKGHGEFELLDVPFAPESQVDLHLAKGKRYGSLEGVAMPIELLP